MAEQNPESGRATAVAKRVLRPATTTSRISTTPPRKKGRRRFIVIGVVAVLIVGALLFWWHSTYYEDTDDAQVDGHLIQISARVAGQVIRVNVEQNQYVQAGTLIAEIDPKDFEVAVKQDEASLQSAEANYEAVRVNVPVIGVNTTSTLIRQLQGYELRTRRCSRRSANWKRRRPRCSRRMLNNIKAQLDLKRYTPLVEKDVISKQQFDATVATADASKAALLGAKASEIAAEDAVRIARDRVVQSQAA